jgi:capsular polysaccharide biosynthesis protein
MNEQTVQIQEIYRIIRGNFIFGFLIVALTAALAFFLALELPKKYKSTAVLNIQSSYFQNPLVSDLLSEVSDPSELKAQRESLLAMALDDQFMDEIGEKYGFYKYPRDHRKRIIERELLGKRITFFSISPTAFQVSAVGRTPQETYLLAGDILAQMRKTFITERNKKLLKAREALTVHTRLLSNQLQSAASPVASLRAELRALEGQIQTISSQYTPNHPSVLKLKERANTIRVMLKKYGAAEDPAPGEQVVNPAAQRPTEDVYSDLVKKLNYLNVLIDMEEDPKNISYIGIVEHPKVPSRPFFPNKRIFALAGMGIGLVLALVFIAFREIRKGTFLSPSHAANSLGMPFLGELPLMTGANGYRLLDGPSMGSLRRTLPPPTKQE